MPDAAGRTIESLSDINDQLGDGLRSQLKPQTAIWALLCGARAALVSMDVAAANAYADAARARLSESGLDDVPDAAYLLMDVDLLASDSRWAAGREEEAIAFFMPPRSGMTQWWTVAFRSGTAQPRPAGTPHRAVGRLVSGLGRSARGDRRN